MKRTKRPQQLPLRNEVIPSLCAHAHTTVRALLIRLFERQRLFIIDTLHQCNLTLPCSSSCAGHSEQAAASVQRSKQAAVSV